jgi:paraquat-inducible protein B
VSQSNENWKVGLFVVGVLSAGVLGLAALGARGLSRETRNLVAYFNESIEGLSVGTPVKFRGVSVGTVSDISFAPDMRHVQVDIAAYVDGLRGLGLEDDLSLVGASLRLEEAGIRLRILRSALTGFTYLEFDVFDGATSPVQELPFTKPFNYVPTLPSTLKSLEDDLSSTLREMPRLLQKASNVLDEIDRVLAELRLEEAGQRLTSLLTRADEKLASFDVEEVDALVADLRRVASALDVEAIARASSQIDEVVASAARTATGIEESTARIGETLDAARGAADAFREQVTAADLGATAQALRESAAAIELLATDAGRASEQAGPALRELERTLVALTALAARLERDPAAILFGTRRDE